MTNSRTMKRALLTSIIALVVCFSMLVGTTFAWFTDSVTSSGNIIQSGTLEVAMSWAEGDEDPNSVAWKDAKDGAIFNNDKWEPGYVEARHLKIENKGTLAFKYKLLITPNGAVEELADVIDVYFIEGATQVNRDSFVSATPVGTLRDLINDVDGAAHGALLPVGQATTNTYERVGVVTSTIAFKMREEAGNEYQGKKIGSDFAIQLLATQYTFENDSIDNGYDGDSTYPNVSVPVAVPADTTQSIALSANGMKMEVPAAALPAGTTTVSLVYTDPTVDTTNNTVTYDSIELVDQDGNIIDLEGNTEEIAVALPEQETFAPGAYVEIFHDGALIAVTRVNADKTISYGVMHFCKVEVKAVPDGKYVAAGANGFYESLADAVKESKAGDTVTLLSDVTLEQTLVLDAGVKLDLGGKTITSNVATAIKVTSETAITNGTIVNVGDASNPDTQHVSILLVGDAKAEIKDVNIETIGIGIYVTENATVTELNANVDSYHGYNGNYLFNAIYVVENARIDLISGGEYGSSHSEEFISAWLSDSNHKNIGLYSTTIMIDGSNASIGEISGGTFLGEMDRGNMGANIYIQAGKVEKISGGYFGFVKYGVVNPDNMFYVNPSNGAIEQIVGGAFEVGDWKGFNCDFNAIVDASGCQVVDNGATVTAKTQRSRIVNGVHKVDTYTLKVVEVVAK